MNDRGRIEELAALVAAGAATDEERAELDAICAADPSAAAELASFEESAALLALALEPVAPPVNALADIQRKLATRSKTIAGPAPAPLDPSASTTPEYAGETRPPERAAEARGEGAEVISLASRRKQRVWAGVTAVSLAAAAAFLLLWLRDRTALQDDLAAKDAEIKKVIDDAQTEIDELGRKLEAAGRETTVLRARFAPLTNAHELSLTRLTNDKEGGVAHVIADKSGKRWLVIAAELPDIAADQDYQLWFVPENGKPISAGLLRPGPDGVLAATPELPADLASDTPVRPAISLEPKGGSEQPTVVKMIGNPI